MMAGAALSMALMEERTLAGPERDQRIRADVGPEPRCKPRVAPSSNRSSCIAK